MSAIQSKPCVSHYTLQYKMFLYLHTVNAKKVHEKEGGTSTLPSLLPAGLIRSHSGFLPSDTIFTYHIDKYA